jgi:hypothetical protein
MYLLRSATPETHSARALLQNFSVVPYRDGIFAARQATNSLRQNRPFLQTSCSFPDSTSSPPSLDRGLTCQPVSKNGRFEPFIYKNDHFAKTGSGQT